MSQTTTPAFSFNEVVSLATKAARGAGFGWGPAEDLGRASRWLAEHGFAWDAALCSLLERGDARAWISRMIELADWAAVAAPGESRDLDGGQDALWILPLVSAAIYGRAKSLEFHWAGALIHLGPDGAIASDRPLEHLIGAVGPITLTPVRDQQLRADQIDRLARPGPLSASALARLSAFADLTLVPATEASRAKGAGSTRPDND